MKSFTHPVQICIHTHYTEIVSGKLLFLKIEIAQSQSHFSVWFSFRQFSKKAYSFTSTPIHIKQTPNDLISGFKLEKCSIIIIISIDVSTSNERKRKTHSNACDQNETIKHHITSHRLWYTYSIIIFIIHTQWCGVFYAVVVLRKLFQKGTKSVANLFFLCQHHRSDACQTNFILGKKNSKRE